MNISELAIANLITLRKEIEIELLHRHLSSFSSAILTTLRESKDHSDPLDLQELMTKSLERAIDPALKVKVTAKTSGVKNKTPRVKFRHPRNKALKWSGSGRTPRWINAWLKNDGATLEQLQIVPKTSEANSTIKKSRGRRMLKGTAGEMTAISKAGLSETSINKRAIKPSRTSTRQNAPIAA